MKRLATFLVGLAKIVTELFHFRGLLLMWGMTISKSLDRLLATREGEVCMKYKDHHMRHPRGHLGDRASAQGTRGCAWRDDQFGRGQNPVNLISLGKTRK